MTDLYVYAPTNKILFKSLVDTRLFDEVKKGNMEEFDIESGDIMKIVTDGSKTADKFKYSSYSSYGKYDWWRYGISNSLDDDTYIEDLKSVAAYLGYSPDMIDELLENGFSPEEIEDYIYF